MSGANQPNLRRGCLMGLVILALFASGFMYWWFQVYSKFNPPEELKPYATRESSLSLIKSKAPAPDQSKRLTQEDIDFYVNSFDSLNSGWRIFDAAWDSTMVTRSPDNDEKFDPLDLDDLGVLFFRTNLYARQSLINYLNLLNRSWDEYQWTKRRVIAASGITQEEFTDTLRNFMVRHNFNIETENRQLASEDLFSKVREIQSGGIDSTEQALVAPFRTKLLTDGMHSLTQIEEQFYGESED